MDTRFDLADNNGTIVKISELPSSMELKIVIHQEGGVTSEIYLQAEQIDLLKTVLSYYRDRII
jgi:hypothetical protein